MKVKFDIPTSKWFNEHPGAQTTVMHCPECGLYYKPDLGHMCKKGKNVWKKLKNEP